MKKQVSLTATRQKHIPINLFLRPGVWATFGGVALVFGTCWWYRIREDPWDAVIARVRARGQPASRADIERLYPFKPAAYTNFLELDRLCRQISKEVPPSVSDWFNGATNLVGPALPAVMVSEAQEWLAVEAAVLDALPALIEKDLDFGCLVTTNGVYYGDNFRKYSVAVYLLLTRSALAWTASDPATAVSALTNALQLIRHQDGNYSSVGASMRIYSLQLARTVCALMFIRDGFDDEQLAGMQRAFEQLLDGPSTHLAYRVDWAGGQEPMRRLRDSIKPTDWGFDLSTWRNRLRMYWWVYSGRSRRDLVDALDTADKRAEALQGTLAGRRARAQAFTEQLQQIQRRRTALLEGSSGDKFALAHELDWTINMEASLSGWLRSMVTALAAERYRLRHQRYPESLDALVPEFLPGVLTDPVDEQPLRYRTWTNGFVVYSMGGNGIDDGGHELNWPRGNNLKATDADAGVYFGRSKP